MYNIAGGLVYFWVWWTHASLYYYPLQKQSKPNSKNSYENVLFAPFL